MDIDKKLLDLEVLFHGPHPGFAGAAIPLPQDIKKFIDDLARPNAGGKQKLMTLQEGLDKIKAVVGDRGELRVDKAKIASTPKTGTIFLYIPNRTAVPRHCFRLIAFVENLT